MTKKEWKDHIGNSCDFCYYLSDECEEFLNEECELLHGKVMELGAFGEIEIGVFIENGCLVGLLTNDADVTGDRRKMNVAKFRKINFCPMCGRKIEKHSMPESSVVSEEVSE